MHWGTVIVLIFIFFSKVLAWTSCLPCVVCFVDLKSMKKVGIYEKHNDLRSTMQLQIEN